jgi:hypothetical protein
MTLHKSTEYTTDIKARRLFGRMQSEIIELGKQIENVKTATHAMRLVLGTATLTLAEIESLHVSQSHDKRINDALLFDAQAQLSELLDEANLKAASASDLVSKQVPKVAQLSTQANRIAEKDIVDDEPKGPLPGLAYVEITFFRDELRCSIGHVRNLMKRGAIPQPDAVSPEEGGRPKFLWLKHKGAVIVQSLKSAGATQAACV